MKLGREAKMTRMLRRAYRKHGATGGLRAFARFVAVAPHDESNERQVALKSAAARWIARKGIAA